MSSAFQFIRLSICAGAFAVASAFGGTFSYSYTFGDGTPVTGTFDGAQSGNLINNVSNVSLLLSGTPVAGPIFTDSWDNGSFSWVDGGAVVSIDGTQNNFFFVNSDYGHGDYNWTAYFLSLSGLDSVTSGWSSVSQPSDNPINSSWKVTPTSVPDSGATVAMLGGTLVGLAVLRRRFRS
jgi:hypothetical protein